MAATAEQVTAEPGSLGMEHTLCRHTSGQVCPRKSPRPRVWGQERGLLTADQTQAVWVSICEP